MAGCMTKIETKLDYCMLLWTCLNCDNELKRDTLQEKLYQKDSESEVKVCNC